MVNPGAFQGMRKEFLMNERESYSWGVEGRYAADALANIQRRYFKRFPIDLPEDQEPTADFLANINEGAPDPEPEVPDPNVMEADEYIAAMKKLEARRKLVVLKKAQIKRWLAYHYTKDHDLDPKESGSHNPYRILIHKLTGVGIKKPRQRSAANTWRKTQSDVINAETKRIAKLADTKRQDLAALRDKIARQMFERLDKDEKEQWEAQAKEEHHDLLMKWEDNTTKPPSTDPADCQRCIQGLASFAKPILDLICEATGWKASLIAGGPEPAHEGRLNIISVHSGMTLGDVKMNFGKAERARYKKYIIPTYGSFLQLCYTPEECKSRALPREEGFDPVIALDSTEEDGVFIDTYEPISANPSRSLTPNPSQIQRSTSASSHRSTNSHVPSTKTSSKLNVKSSSALPAPQPVLPPSSAPPNQNTQMTDLIDLFPIFPWEIPTAGAETPNSRPVSPLVGMSPPPSPQSPAHPLTPQINVMELPQRSGPSLNPGTVETVETVETSVIPVISTCATMHALVEVNSEVLHVVEPRQRSSPTSNPVETGGTQAVTPTSPTKRKLDDINSENIPMPSPIKRQRQTRNRRSMHIGLPQSESAKVTASLVVPTPSPSAPVHASSPSPNIQEVGHGEKSGSTTETPEWFEAGLLLLREEDLGEDWTALLELWTTYERKNQFKEVRRLKTQHRPTLLKEWIQQSRPNLSVWAPVISDIAQYEKDFLTWWRSLQPTWRLSKNDGNLIRSDGDWEPLNRPGINGLLTVLAGLFYWGLTVRKKRAAFRSWSHAVKDVVFVMKKLVDFCS